MGEGGSKWRGFLYSLQLTAFQSCVCVPSIRRPAVQDSQNNIYTIHPFWKQFIQRLSNNLPYHGPPSAARSAGHEAESDPTSTELNQRSTASNMLLDTINSSEDPLGLGSTRSWQTSNAWWLVAVDTSKAPGNAMKHLIVLLGLASPIKTPSLAEHPCNGLLIDHIELNSPGKEWLHMHLIIISSSLCTVVIKTIEYIIYNFTSIWLPQGHIVDLEQRRKHETKKEKPSDGPFRPWDEKSKTAKSLPVITSWNIRWRIFCKHWGAYGNKSISLQLSLSLRMNAESHLSQEFQTASFYKTEPSLPLAAPPAMPPARNGERGPEEKNSHQPARQQVCGEYSQIRSVRCITFWGCMMLWERSWLTLIWLTFAISQ